MDVLYPVTHVTRLGFSGKLLIDGDLKSNCILFRFLFDSERMVHPLLIYVRATALPKGCSEEGYGHGEKTCVLQCNTPDCNNPLMKTRLIYPEFLLSEYMIEVTDIQSQVSCRLYMEENRD